ncbi:hypothetical protein COV15_00120 [Candidatus Woesearchaeota archaeon CG10_big_fil_rev_8_21_14_0_10_34_12]|nr:MAG: hypothetical protein COV15_00120 [Candidatus Woesearchaeota archaeon CG10_big_fil_rev_8_21_14_0_10_34_12]
MRFKEGLATLALTAGLAFASNICGQESTLASREGVAKVAVERKDNYTLLKDYLARFSDSLLNEMAEKSKIAGKNLKKYGKDFREAYLNVHISCLEFAKKSLEKGIDAESAYSKVAGDICGSFEKYFDRANYSDKNVLKAEEEWVRERVKFFSALLKAEGRFKSGEEIILAVYPGNSYSDYITLQNQRTAELYTALENTMGDLEWWLGGKTEINNASTAAQNFYLNSVPK